MRVEKNYDTNLLTSNSFCVIIAYLNKKCLSGNLWIYILLRIKLSQLILQFRQEHGLMLGGKGDFASEDAMN